MDIQIRRHKFASADLMKIATKVPKEMREVKQKNITSDAFTTKGTIHMPRQDLSILYSKAKKAKALRPTPPTKEIDTSMKRKAEEENTEGDAVKRTRNK